MSKKAKKDRKEVRKWHGYGRVQPPTDDVRSLLLCAANWQDEPQVLETMAWIARGVPEVCDVLRVQSGVHALRTAVLLRDAVDVERQRRRKGDIEPIDLAELLDEHADALMEAVLALSASHLPTPSREDLALAADRAFESPYPEAFFWAGQQHAEARQVLDDLWRLVLEAGLEQRHRLGLTVVLAHDLDLAVAAALGGDDFQALDAVSVSVSSHEYRDLPHALTARMVREELALEMLGQRVDPDDAEQVRIHDALRQRYEATRIRVEDLQRFLDTGRRWADLFAPLWQAARALSSDDLLHGGRVLEDLVAQLGGDDPGAGPWLLHTLMATAQRDEQAPS